MSTSLLSLLVCVALAVAVLALVVAVAAWRKASRRGRSKVPGPRSSGHDRLVHHRPHRGHGSGGEATSSEVAAEVERLRGEVGSALRHMAVVRYDAFGDMGGHLSWSLALLDDAGDGVVITSIHGRSDSRTYAKNVTGGTAAQQLAPEEEEAISYALPS